MRRTISLTLKAMQERNLCLQVNFPWISLIIHLHIQYVQPLHGVFPRCLCSLRGRRLKGKGKGSMARDHARGRREEGNACKETIVFAIPPTKLKNNKNNATVND